VAGALIMSLNLNELNYAPEIAAAMLKKQVGVACARDAHPWPLPCRPPRRWWTRAI
jgi:hypothetical protein